MTLYLDNAATTWPKPDRVYEAVQHAMRDVGASPGRAAHRHAREASDIVTATREKVARLLGIPDAEAVIFTKNATESINVVLKGWLRPGDRVIFSGMEHNAVVRPVERLKLLGVEAEVIPCTSSGLLDLEVFREKIAARPRLAVLNHASNVNGGIQPVSRVAELCSDAGVPLLLDAAQTAGVQPVSAKDLNLGMLACSGHKGLLGPSGMGVLYIRPDLDVPPLMEGGTGSRSEDALQPDCTPDRYESGTLNLPGIAGLGAGIDFILERGISSIRDHELELAFFLEDGLNRMSGVSVYRPAERGTGTVSFTVEGLNPGDVGYLLDQAFDTAVRTGLHCAPLAHETLGSFPQGTVRVSPGIFSTMEEMDYFLKSLRSLLMTRRR